MSESAMLNLILFLPLVGIALLMLVPADKPQVTRRLTLAMMTVQFALTAWLYMRFSSSVEGLQFATRIPWIDAWGVSYHIGLDGFNVLLVLLTAFLGPLVVAGAFSASST